MNLHILDFTNYANRDVEWHATLGDYPDALDVIPGVNFKELDGITTSQVVNTDVVGNYLLVTDGENNILSRWYILEATKQREHQYLLSLRRDVIADNYAAFTTSTAYITKGYVDDVESPLIFNNEGVKLNEVKQQEILLRDKYGGNAWYVMYISTKMFEVTGEEYTESARFKSTFTWNIPDFSDEYNCEITVPQGEYIEFVNGERYVKLGPDCTFCANFNNNITDSWQRIGTYSSQIARFSAKLTVGLLHGNYWVGVVPASVTFDPEFPRFVEIIKDPAKTYSIFDTTSMIVMRGPSWVDRVNVISPYYIYTMPVQTSTLGDEEWKDIDTKWAANVLARQYSGSNYIYDIQIIPFCPIAERWLGGTTYKASPHDMEIYEAIPGGWNIDLLKITSAVRVLKDSYGDELPFTGIVLPDDPVDFKLSTTRKYRLNSGNYASSYEFNPSMNHGVDAFNYNILLQPFQPYIYIAPKYNAGSLYGRDYNDARGLVCGGNYSIAQSSSEWMNYVLTNKNNEAAFDRQISTLMANNMTNAVSAGAGLASAATSAALGFATGGPVGAMVGAGVGLAGNVLSAGLSAARDANTLSDTKARHEYDLRAIQARPDTIKHVSIWSKNAKYWPFIEVYDCTMEEKQALRRKLEVDGMTVNTIDQPQMYMKNDGKWFIQGELIRCNVTEPHVFNEINNEFMKGVRM